jgi:MYXO-CTERM domain-containing protein
VRKSILAAGAAALVLAVALPSRANGRFPAANQLVFSPQDPNYMVLRATYAILPSADNGFTWRYLCEGVIGLPADQGEDPSVGIMSNGNLIVGVPGAGSGGRGMDLSVDRGCNWSCESDGLLDQSIVDLAVRPDNAMSAVAVTGTIQPNDGSTPVLYSNQVFETIDDGKTWTLLGGFDPRVIVTTIDVTKSDPDRLYVTGTIGYAQFARAVFLVSKDHGKTWTENNVPQFDPTLESGIYIGAIDPGNADRVYVRSAAVKSGGLSRVYYTINGGAVGGASGGLDASSDGGAIAGGATFSLGTTLPAEGGFDTDEGGMFDITGELLGMALSPDGSKIYVGTVESGLWIANTSDMMFAQKNASLHVKCLATRNDELWACSEVTVPGTFTLGISHDDGATFQPRIQYVQSLCGPVECTPNPGGPLGCGSDSNGASCADAYHLFCEQNDTTNSCGTCPGSDSGAPTPNDAGSGSQSGNDAGTTPKGGTPSSSSCSCSSVGRGGAGGFAAGLGFAGLGALAFSRRRRGRR